MMCVTCAREPRRDDSPQPRPAAGVKVGTVFSVGSRGQRLPDRGLFIAIGVNFRRVPERTDGHQLSDLRVGGLSRIAKKRPESFLFKMPVIGKNLGQSFFAHRLHGNTIDQAVALVRPLCIESHAGEK